MKNEDKKTRVQFELPREVIERMDEMKNLTGASSRAEVLRNALKCYRWILDQRGHGFKVAAIDSETKEVLEIISPFLLYR